MSIFNYRRGKLLPVQINIEEVNTPVRRCFRSFKTRLVNASDPLKQD